MIKKIKNCLNCSQEFIVTRDRLKFCSVKCANSYLAPRRSKKLCEKCKRKIDSSMFNRHHVVCNGKIRQKVDEQWRQPNDKYKCPYCAKEFTKRGIGGHIWRMHTKKGRQFEPSKGIVAWNKGLTKRTDARIAKSAEKYKMGLKTGKFLPGMLGRKLNEEAKQKIRKARIGKKGFDHPTRKAYKYFKADGTTIILDSSFEVKVAKDLDYHEIAWERPKALAWVDQKDITHRYFPDFYLINYDIYLDPKNDYLIKRDAEKIRRVQKQNNVTVLVLNSSELSWASIQRKL